MFLALLRSRPLRMLALVVFPLQACVFLFFLPDVCGPVWALFASGIASHVMNREIARVCSSLPSTRARLGRMVVLMAVWAAVTPFVVVLGLMAWIPMLADGLGPITAMLQAEAVVAAGIVARLLMASKPRRLLDVAFMMLVAAAPALRLFGTQADYSLALHYDLQLVLLWAAAPIAVYYVIRAFADARQIAYARSKRPDHSVDAAEEDTFFSAAEALDILTPVHHSLSRKAIGRAALETGLLLIAVVVVIAIRERSADRIRVTVYALIPGVILLRPLLLALLSVRCLRAFPLTARYIVNRLVFRTCIQTAMVAVVLAALLSTFGKTSAMLNGLCLLLALPSAGTFACCAFLRLPGMPGFVLALAMSFGLSAGWSFYPIPLAVAAVCAFPAAYWLLLRVVAGTPNASLPRVS